MTGHWRSREQLVHQVVTLARDGVSQRAIARAVGVSRNTVKAVLAAHAHGREAEHVALPPILTRAPRASKLDAFKPRVAELMARFADITAQRVFELLRSEGFGGGYTAVKKHMRRVRPAPKPTPSLTTPDYGPGEMAESDWSPYTESASTMGSASGWRRSRTCSSPANGSSSRSTRATVCTR